MQLLQSAEDPMAMQTAYMQHVAVPRDADEEAA